jgi:hypothetical protein
MMSTLSEQAWRDFSASTALLRSESASIHERYLNKWIGIYKGQIEASGDTFDLVIEGLVDKNISTADSLIRFIGQKEMTLIL